MADRPLLLRKLADLDRHRRELSEFEGVDVEAYARDWKVQRIVERTLQMMVEICADIAGHIIAQEGLRVPASVADSFRSLAEGGALPAELLPRMERMAGFRNVVVHQYDAVDGAIVVAILRGHLGDFEQFRDAIVAFLGGQREERARG